METKLKRISKLLSALFLTLFVFLAFTACENKTYFSQLTFTNRERYAYKDGAVFDGSAWSSNEKMRADFKEGVLQKATVFFDDGNVAVVSINTGKNLDVEYFDENGNIISESQFKSQYSQTWNMIMALEGEVHNVD